MPEKFEKSVQETEVAFAFTILLVNILLLAVIGGVVWLMQSLIMLDSPLSEILRASAWR